MNAKQLANLGVPKDCLNIAIQAIQNASVASKRSGSSGEKKESNGCSTKRNFKKFIPTLVAEPEKFVEDEHFGQFAIALIEEREFVRPDPIDYKVWGRENIEQESFHQMERCCSMPNAAAAVLMPDAHAGYGLPIGGVLALDNAVCPYAVGVDIACRMKLSVLDLPVPNKKLWFSDKLDKALNEGTRFGMGVVHERKQRHDIMDEDWNITGVTRKQKDKAWSQLGTSGGGNHFVEFGLLTLSEPDMGLEAGNYVALMSHSGSRGPGLAVCDFYSTIANSSVPARYDDLSQARLGWLDLDAEAGMEYWMAMNLMGRYAAANHDVIHRLVSKLAGAEILAQVENHHNFAWKEQHYGKELVVHRKGATPASEGEMGVIPGSMATPAFVVRGKGNADSLRSASHGAGRCMSRKKAKDIYNFKAVQKDLEKKGVRVLRAGADEVPGVYKRIQDVMDAQTDLVDIVAQFDPKVVVMAGESEDRRKKKSEQKRKFGNDADW